MYIDNFGGVVVFYLCLDSIGRCVNGWATCLGSRLYATRILWQIADALQGIEVLGTAAHLQGLAVATDIIVVAACQGGKHEAVGLVAAHIRGVEVHA